MSKKFQQVLDNKIEQKEDELRQVYYEKYNRIFEDVIEFLKDRDVILYGGYALNQILPNNLKIYKSNELPDIDIFALNPSTLIRDLKLDLKKKGYQYISDNEALHENTFKVFTEGLQILDVTQLKKSIFESIKKSSVDCGNGLHCVSPLFLKMTLHTLLSQPVDINRWAKVVKRMLSLYTLYPPDYQCPPVSIQSFKRPFETSILKWAKTHGYPVYDITSILNHYPTLKSIVGDQSTPIQIVVESMKPALKTFPIKSVTKRTFKSNPIYANQYVDLSYRGKLIARLVEANACYSSFQNGGQRYLGIQSLLRLYLQEFLFDIGYLNPLQQLCVIDELTRIALKNFENPKNRFVDSFILTCYGRQAGLATLKRRQLSRNRKTRKQLKTRKNKPKKY